MRYLFAVIVFLIWPLFCDGRADGEEAAPVQTHTRLPLSLERWAVLSFPKGSATILSELLTVELTAKRWTLVERERIGAVLEEQRLSSTFRGGAVGDIVRLGKLLQADALVLLGRDQEGDATTLRMVVCECRYGIRLSIDRLSLKPGDVEAALPAIVGLLEDVRERFRGGITAIVALTPFLSQDLVSTYDSYQSILAGVLEKALSVQPGIAVVETKWAGAIANELRLHARRGVKRIVPVLVEPEYRVSESGSPRVPKVRIKTRLILDEGERETLNSGLLSLQEGIAYVRTVLAVEILHRLDGVGEWQLSNQEQYEHFIQRADNLARLGDVIHAREMREAALLLQPQEVDQRLQVIDEYACVKSLKKYSSSYMALDHLEYLVDSGAITQHEALQKAIRIFRSAWPLRTEFGWYKGVEMAWLERTFPRILQLDLSREIVLDWLIVSGKQEQHEKNGTRFGELDPATQRETLQTEAWQKQLRWWHQVSVREWEGSLYAMAAATRMKWGQFQPFMRRLRERVLPARETYISHLSAPSVKAVYQLASGGRGISWSLGNISSRSPREGSRKELKDQNPNRLTSHIHAEYEMLIHYLDDWCQVQPPSVFPDRPPDAHLEFMELESAIMLREACLKTAYRGWFQLGLAESCLRSRKLSIERARQALRTLEQFLDTAYNLEHSAKLLSTYDLLVAYLDRLEMVEHVDLTELHRQERAWVRRVYPKLLKTSPLDGREIRMCLERLRRCQERPEYLSYVPKVESELERKRHQHREIITSWKEALFRHALRVKRYMPTAAFDSYLNELRDEVIPLGESVVRRHARNEAILVPPVRKGRVTCRSFDQGITVRKLDGTLQEGFPNVVKVIQCGTRLDVWWSRKHVYFMTRTHLMREVHVEGGDKDALYDVVYDGRYLWLVNANGLKVMDLTGRIVGSVGPDQGLPPFDHAGKLHAIGPGKVLVIGTFGKKWRSWCGVVSWQAGVRSVNVFLEGKRHRNGPSRSSGGVENTLDISFYPSWLFAYEGEHGESLLAIGRATTENKTGVAKGQSSLNTHVWESVPLPPLVINLETLDTSVHPRHLEDWQFLRELHRSHLEKFDVRAVPEGFQHVFPYGGWTYLVGLWDEGKVRNGSAVVYARWYRVNRKTGAAEFLGDTNHFVSGHLAVTAHYGLVWTAGGIGAASPCQIQIDEL